jgi:hypothetical protein
MLRGRGLGASVVAGLAQSSPPLPGTMSAVLGVTFAPLGQSPNPKFLPGPMAVDYAWPTVAPVPTVATLVDTAMEPMGAPLGAGGGGGSSVDPNMPAPFRGVPPSLMQPSPFRGVPPSLVQPTSTSTDLVPPPASASGSSLSPDELAAIQAENQALDANEQRQRKIWTTIAVGGAVVGGVLLLARMRP